MKAVETSRQNGEDEDIRKNATGRVPTRVVCELLCALPARFPPSLMELLWVFFHDMERSTFRSRMSSRRRAGVMGPCPDHFPRWTSLKAVQG